MAKKKDKRFTVERKWLNPASSYNSGYIISGITKDDSYFSGRLKIADCSRIIDLDVDVDSSKARKLTLRKLKIIQDALDRMVKQINIVEKES